jgi:8-hydroxy-5-deazaflavin:NADPH oxidoreductase
MKIAIIGAGSVGRALGRAWLAAGHDVTFGVRDPKDPKHRELGEVVGKAVHVADVRSPAAGAEVIVLATPWPATRSAIESAGDLAGKLVIDCTNPLAPDLSGLTVGHNSSGGEQVAAWAPGASVFKAFNSTGFNIMASPVVDGRRAVMFFCGDDDSRRAVVEQLVTDVGFEAINAGDLTAARLLEPFALLWISLAYRRGLGRNFAFALVRR